jgi:biotin carboxyl carrier protein
VAIAAVLALHRRSRVHGPLALFSSSGHRETPMRIEVADRTFEVRLIYAVGAAVQAHIDDARFSVQVLHDDALHARVEVNGQQAAVVCAADGWLDAFGQCAAFADTTDVAPRREDPASHGLITSRMHGQLLRLQATSGQRVRKGEFLLAIEAMKMEHRIDAPIDGTVVEVGAATGSQVVPGQLLLRIEADAST